MATPGQHSTARGPLPEGGAQGMHAAGEGAARSGLAVLAGQGRHAATLSMPVRLLKVPAGHATLAPPLHTKPAGHTLAVRVTDPNGHWYPAEHGPEHADLPLTHPHSTNTHSTRDRL